MHLWIESSENAVHAPTWSSLIRRCCWQWRVVVSLLETINHVQWIQLKN